ncbi:MAG: 16S rRNA (cytosine(1402)-N(4))-methyltransferase RsmH [Lachnospiraceae bacterium]|nr:16S rRNA (cytosine(1402)-N(4))-methyltransferase RsmH [Lachnospiraceae bacterium]
MEPGGFSHIPVLLHETIDGLNIRPDGIYIDGTAGGGGHSAEILKRLGENGRLVCIDRDSDAIETLQGRFGGDLRVTVVKSNYGEFERILKEQGIEKADGILLDLGVSSHQLDTTERGFSYLVDTPLDMRMDTEETATAADIVNGYSEAELYRIIRDYGEDRFAKNIAKHIVNNREHGPIETTGQLAQIIAAAIPMKVQKTGGHPAKRTFQAIRIELNRELAVLEESIDVMIDHLAEGGRFCVITFHSLEDRIVKNKFKTAEDPCICPKSFPVCVCGRVSKGRVITKKAILPDEEEQETNRRSKSAKLRIFERA